MKRQASAALFERACKVIPGGVNSPVRAFKAVGGHPLFLAKGKGPRVWDVDGNSFLDYCGSWGPLILGHAHEAVLAAAVAAARDGSSFGAPTEREVVLAETIAKAIPSMEKVRLTSSGTEATMSAIRVARAVTGHESILKFEGCYHGHSDGLLVKAGSGVATLGLPDSPGVPAEVASLTLTARYNSLDAADEAFRTAARARKPIAAVILEPVVGNMGVVLPAPGFLRGLRALCDAHQAMLIFDEVITGFRLGYGGYQKQAEVVPDLTCLGKILGGGLPIGAYGGAADFMDQVAPAGAVYQAGTLSGNPVAVAAGLAMLAELAKPGVYESLEAKGSRLAKGLLKAGQDNGGGVRVQRAGSMMTVFFAEEPVVDWPSAAVADKARFARWHTALLEEGIYWPPAQFEAAFVSTAHEDPDLDATIAAAGKAFAKAR